MKNANFYQNSRSLQFPLVSIITPVYNNSKTIRQAIESLIHQDFQEWEMICVADQGTTDNSRQIIDEIAKSDPRIHRLEMHNARGVGSARTYGIQHARSRFIAFLDADDLWLPKKLTTQVRFMKKNSYAFTCTGFRRMSNEGKVHDRLFLPSRKITYEDLLKNNNICCGSVMLDKNQTGPLEMKNLAGEDFILWLDLLGRRGLTCYGLQEDLVRYRITQNSLSRSFIKTAIQRWNVYRKLEHLSIAKSLFLFLNYTITALAKRL